MQHCVGGLGLLRRKTAIISSWLQIIILTTIITIITITIIIIMIIIIIRSWFQTPFPKG